MTNTYERTTEILIEGKVVNIPHTGITLKTINKIALLDWLTSGGSRYYEIRCAGVHVGRLAVDTRARDEDDN